MMRTAALAMLLAMLPVLAEAASCARRAEFLQHLSKNFEESPVAMGLTSDGKIIEVVASESGTWTLIMTLPNGMSCGMASGEAWSKSPQPAAKADNVSF